MEKTNKDFLETDSEEIKEYTIPVQWMVASTLSVKARNLREAIEWVEDNIDTIKLPQNAEYIEESFKLNDRDSFTEHDYAGYVQEVFNDGSEYIVSNTKEEYKNYVKEWCNSRGYEPEEVDEEIGINNGECYVCYDEFLDNDLLNYSNIDLIA